MCWRQAPPDPIYGKPGSALFHDIGKPACFFMGRRGTGDFGGPRRGERRHDGPDHAPHALQQPGAGGSVRTGAVAR